MKNPILDFTLYIALAVAAATAFGATAQNRVIVSKPDLRLMVVSASSDTLMNVPCSVGLNKGQKRAEGDMRTPEGHFSVSMIQNSSRWTHDFNDGFGKRKGAYGPWFIRLAVPGATGIGIHGTCFPESMGTRSSEGCVRLLDSDVVRLRNLIRVGTEVIILPDGPRMEPVGPLQMTFDSAAPLSRLLQFQPRRTQHPTDKVPRRASKPRRHSGRAGR